MNQQPHNFNTASCEIYLCLQTVEDVRQKAKSGYGPSAYANLQILKNVFDKCYPTLCKYHDQLIVESDGPVDPIEIAGETHYWSSAHQAATGIVELTLKNLFYPVVGDWKGMTRKRDKDGRWTLDKLGEWTQVTDQDEQHRRAKLILAKRGTWFDVDPVWLAKLYERLKRERAKVIDSERKLLAAETVTSSTTNGKQPTSKKRGRKSKLEEHKEIAAKYDKGLKSGKYKNQEDFRAKEHSDKSAAWMSKVLDRVAKLENS